MVQPFFVLSDIVFFILRLVVGITLLYKGFEELKILKEIPKGEKKSIFSYFILLVEVIGGFFIIAGLFTQLASLIMIIILAIERRAKKLKHFDSKECLCALLFFVALLVLMSVGGGVWSIDDFLGLIFF